MSDGGLSTDEKLVVGGGGVAAVGALLPWGEGGVGLGTPAEIVVLFAAIVLVGLVFVADWTKTAQLLAALVGLAIAGVAVYVLLKAFGVIGSGTTAAGAGLYVTLLAGLVVLAGGVRGYTNRKPEAGMYSHR